MPSSACSVAAGPKAPQSFPGTSAPGAPGPYDLLDPAPLVEESAEHGGETLAGALLLHQSLVDGLLNGDVPGRHEYEYAYVLHKTSAQPAQLVNSFRPRVWRGARVHPGGVDLGSTGGRSECAEEVLRFCRRGLEPMRQRAGRERHAHTPPASTVSRAHLTTEPKAKGRWLREGIHTVPHSADIKARLDARGLECPEPVLRTRRILKTLRPGDRIEVLADDPIAPIDFAAFSHRSGHPLRESSRLDGAFRFVIEHK